MSGRKLYYVYVLEDSRDGSAFYVGKGCRRRAYAHTTESNLRLDGNRYKVNKIKKIRREGGSVKVRKVVEDVSEEKAFRLEKELIRELGFENLTNMTYGGEGASLSEEMKANLRQFHLGKTLSEKTKRRISRANRGTGSWKAILTEQEASEILWLCRNTKYRYVDVGKLYGMERGGVIAIADRENWKHVEPKRPDDDILAQLKGKPTVGKVRAPNLNKLVVGGIKWLLKHTNLSRSEIASIYGIEKITVSQIDNGINHSDVTTVEPPGYNPWSELFYPDIEFNWSNIRDFEP
jgi:hypothetical protein